MDKVVSRDGTTIAYKRTGDGPSVVLVNGALRDHKVWDALVPDLAAHCTTYVGNWARPRRPVFATSDPGRESCL
jgi:pimeloyl-ACP methyl ester carboxylesterase